MPGLFITFEGTEGSGKSTQARILTDRLRADGFALRFVREPGGTSIGEEIRHTLKHSTGNRAMFPEAELLLMCASRAQLVREVIEPALSAGEIIVCDRFSDSTVAYQGFGRGLDLRQVEAMVEYATGKLRPHVTFVLSVPVELSESRRAQRPAEAGVERDRMEEADREFFCRVDEGYRSIAAAEPGRVKVIDGEAPVEKVSEAVWRVIEPMLVAMGREGDGN